MKTLRILLLVAFVSGAAAVAAAETNRPRTTDRLPGVDLTEGIAQITGVAISPLLGVSTIGAWRYYRTPPGERDGLPWFCQPVFWGAGFCLIALCFLKDALGTATPALVKKPLDVAELFENKLSALVASVAFLPFIAAQIAAPVEAVHVASLAPLEPSITASSAYWIVLPLCVIAFLIVWLTSHAINVLIMLSPFGLLDAFLKTLRLGVLSSVVLAYLINPWFGATVSAVILCAAALLAPWALRLTVFGTVLATDTILPSRAARHTRADCPHAFLAQRLGAAPVRTFGRLAHDAQGNTCFEYRPWFLLAKRSVALPGGALAISRGIFFPSLVHGADGTAFRNLINFPPRYRGCEAAIAARFGTEVHDGTLIRGYRAMRAWFAYAVGMQRQA